MTTYTYSGTYNSSGTFQFGTTYDELHFTSSANVYSTSTSGAVYGNGDDHLLRIDGAVRGLNYGARMYGDDNEVVISQNGSLGATNYQALSIGGDDAKVTNDGSIFGGSQGIYLYGDEGQIENRGTISGDTGVYVTSGKGTVLENEGRITGNGDEEYHAGVVFTQEDAMIINREGGVIEGTGDEAAGVKLQYDADDSVIENYGEITSDEWYGVDFANLYDNATATLINEGIVEGDEGAFLGSEGDDTVVNKGEMIGDVMLDEGDDVYRGVKDGSVDGVVDGGEGDDLMIGSKADDTFNGGDDDDMLRSRGGDDDLDGGHGHDTIKAGAGDDTMFGNAGNDLLLGGGGDDEMDGGSGEDILAGGKGNDTLTGGKHADTFIFTRKAGDDRVTDFGDGNDKLDISAMNVDSWGELRSSGAIDEFGGGTLIDLSEIGGNGSIYLQGVDADDLSGNDFIF